MTTPSRIHPRQVLLGPQAATQGLLPVCDHYSGIPSRMVKSLQLQQQLQQEFGVCVMDVTLDCEDGAPVGHERQHAELVADLVLSSTEGSRVGVRVHPIFHPAFTSDVAVLVGRCVRRLSHIMLPKVESVQDVDNAIRVINDYGGLQLPVHVLLESPLAIYHAYSIAAHPRVQSISFGLMDFVSTHAGAIPASAMTVQGQFSHPLVVQAKLQLASACHAFGKTPTHCVITEFTDAQTIEQAAVHAAQQLGYTRMWSIHPDQVRPILKAFTPTADEIGQATAIIDAAVAARWAPISYEGRLHDRASYRYYWQVLERAYTTGQSLSPSIRSYFES